MNEQIRELAHKAEFINKRHNGDEWRWGYIDPELSVKLEKFAELIVRECAGVLVAEMNRLDGLDRVVASQTMDTAQVLIKQHFGVEE